MHYSPSEDQPAQQDAQHYAAVFVDYENLHALLSTRLDRDTPASAYIADVLDELQRYLLDSDATQTTMTRAYADFSVLRGERGSVEQALYLQGVEPRFVPATLQANASEIQLCVDAVDLLHRRADVKTFALVTGDRAFLPLVQALRRYGRHAFVVALEMPRAIDEVEHGESDVFLDLRNLLDESARRALQDGSAATVRPPARRRSTSAAAAPTRSHERLSNPVAHRTLEIAEEYFGQYEEIYLTPLLRKLSELLGSQHDPKSLVSELEEASAVRLEKRQGYPYDYTVLIMHYDHPDVEEMQRRFYGYGRDGASAPDSAPADEPAAAETYDAEDSYDAEDDYGDAYDEYDGGADDYDDEAYDEYDDYDEAEEDARGEEADDDYKEDEAQHPGDTYDEEQAR